MLNPARIWAALERISQQNRALGLILAGYADGYAYTEIFDAIATEGDAKGGPVVVPPALGTGRLQR
jgi:hypothetical protein